MSDRKTAKFKVTSSRPKRTSRLHLDRRAAQIAAVEQASSDDPITDDDLLRTSDVAQWFGVTKAWLEGGRRLGYGPPFLQITPAMVRYKRSELRAWLAERQFQCTAQYPECPNRKRGAQT